MHAATLVLLSPLASISPLNSFLQPNLVAEIGKLLRDTALPPDILKLEITESTVMAAIPSAAVDTLLQIKSLGRPAIHRRLRHGLFFAELPAPLSAGHAENRPLLHRGNRYIKWEEKSAEIVRTILPMANSLRLQRNCRRRGNGRTTTILRKTKVREYAQGYYFSRDP